jgi:hypothetical protein
LLRVGRCQIERWACGIYTKCPQCLALTGQLRALCASRTPGFGARVHSDVRREVTGTIGHRGDLCTIPVAGQGSEREDPGSSLGENVPIVDRECDTPAQGIHDLRPCGVALDAHLSALRLLG